MAEAEIAVINSMMEIFNEVSEEQQDFILLVAEDILKFEDFCV